MSNTRMFVVAGVLIALGLALFVSPWASGDPDGLNRVAIDNGFDDAERGHSLDRSPVAGYAVEGVDGDRLSKALSGVVGVLVTFGIGIGLFALLRVRGRGSKSDVAGEDT